MQSCDKDVIQFVLQCYFETTIVQIFQVDGDFHCHGFGQCGMVLFNHFFMNFKFKNKLTTHFDLLI